SHGLSESQRRCPQICSSTQSWSSRWPWRGGGGSMASGSGMGHLHDVVQGVPARVQAEEAEADSSCVFASFEPTPVTETRQELALECQDVLVALPGKAPREGALGDPAQKLVAGQVQGELRPRLRRELDDEHRLLAPHDELDPLVE